METNSDLVGRLRELLETGGTLGVWLLTFGLIATLFLAVFGMRKFLILLFLLALTFSGFSVVSLASGSTLFRWWCIVLLALSCSRGWTFPGWPMMFLVGTGLLAMVFAVGSEAGISFSIQRSGLMVVFALPMAAAVAYAASDLKGIWRIILSFNIAAGLFVVLGMASLGSLQEGSRFSGIEGGTGGAPLFVLTGGFFLPYALYGAITWRSKIWKLYCIALTVGLALLCIVSAQRTGTFAGIIGCLPLLLRFGIKKMLIAMLVLGICAVIVVGVFSQMPDQAAYVQERFFTTDTTGRTDIWRAVLPTCLEHPFMGHGVGAGYLVTAGGLHSAFLTAWYEIGIIGMLLFLGCFVFSAWISFRLVLQSIAPELRELGRLFLGTTLACLACGCFEESLFSPSNVAAFVGMSSAVMSWRLWKMYCAYRDEYLMEPAYAEMGVEPAAAAR